MSLKIICLFSLFVITLWAQSTSVGYYIDNTYNLVQVPVISLPSYLAKDYVIGVASFFNRLNTTGWTFLQVSTNKKYSDYEQMYAAGFLEGAATFELIWDAWNNFNEFMLHNASVLPPNVRAFVQNQTEWIRKAIDLSSNNNYFKLVNSTLGQVKGLYDGYMTKVNETQRKEMYLTFDQFYFLTNMGDLQDIIPAFNASVPKDMECSAFVKLTPDDLITSHNTFNMYSFMLRVFKSYFIPLNNPIVKVKTLMFSSRPGDLESKDDFYILDNNIVVLETSLNNYNHSNCDSLNYATIPTWLRTLVSNRISSNGQEWANAFIGFHSGTHNNQWLVIDYNKYNTYKKNLSNAEGIVWMVEEFWALQKSEDVTQKLLVADGYVASYNVPYFKEIYDVSGYDKGYGYNYTTDPRALLFKKYAPTVKDIPTAKHLIRYNNISDYNDLCSSIAPRCDLMKDGAYDFGAIDAKVTNNLLVKQLTAHIISGPTTDDLPPFTWDHWLDRPHRGMPEIYDFDWLLYTAVVGPISLEDDIETIQL